MEILGAFALVGCFGAMLSWVLDARSGHVLERTCVLKLGSKVNEDLLRQSQFLLESEQDESLPRDQSLLR
jgi:hypothetical protein